MAEDIWAEAMVQFNGVQLGIDALAIWLSYEMKGSKHKEFRQIWWVIPSVVGTTHGVMGGLNCRYIW